MTEQSKNSIAPVHYGKGSHTYTKRSDAFMFSEVPPYMKRQPGERDKEAERERSRRKYAKKKAAKLAETIK